MCVWYNKNKYLVFVLSSWYRAPKSLGIYCLLYANEVAPEMEWRWEY